MSERGSHSMSERRAAQAVRIAERNAFVTEQAATHARIRRAAMPDGDKAALMEVLVPLWEKSAEGFPPPMVTLLRWLLFGIIPMVGSASIVMLGSCRWDLVSHRFEVATVAVACTVLFLATVMAAAVGMARLRRLSVAAARRIVRAATVAYAIVGVASLVLAAVLTILVLSEPSSPRVQRAEGDGAALFLFCAVGPLLALGVALLVHDVDVRSARSVERVAQRCGGRVEVGATALRRWLDRWWEGEVSHEQLEWRSDSAYVVSAQIEGFAIAIEIRADSGTRPPIQVLVAAQVEKAGHSALAGLDAWLQASGFIAQVSTGGIAARPWRGERGLTGRTRDDALVRLHECAVGIVSSLRRAGVHPLEPLVEGLTRPPKQ